MRFLLPKLVVASLLSSSMSLHAQTLRGTVRDAVRAPVSGAIVQLVDSASHIVAQQLSSASGTFRIAFPFAGTYRLHTLRIGYTPTLSPPIEVKAGSETVQDIVLSSIRIALDTVHVTGKSTCRVSREEAASTLSVWEQVRTALTATQLSLEDSGNIATTVSYERRLDPVNGRVRAQRSSTATGAVREPWLAASLAQLRRDGYVRSDSSGTTYEAPGLDILLSDSFLEDHCVHLVNEPGFGIAFEPTRERSKLPEIKGTIWLNQETSELRQLQYRYANLPSEHDRALGLMEFAKLANGAWAISRWSIRMPVLEQRSKSVGLGRQHFMTTEVVVGDLVETGGVLASFRRGADTLFAAPPITLSGTIRDSLSRRPAAGAYVTIPHPPRATVADSLGRFAITGLLPGEYVLDVQTSDIDSIGSYRLRVPLVTSDSIEVRVPPARSLAAQRAAPRAARFSGAVFSDSTRRPVADVEVALPDLGLAVSTNSAGVFDMRDIPPGVQRVSLRKLGYGKLDTTITFRAGASVSREVFLSRVVTLDSVIVTESAVLPTFEEHRKMGLGHFLTREELSKQEGRMMSSVIAGMLGTKIMPGTSTHAFVATNRGPRNILGNDLRRAPFGAKPACYSNVFLDRVPIYSGRSNEEPPDINALVSADRLEAVEFYASAAQIPDMYAGLNTVCGVLVLWSRKSYDDAKSAKKDSTHTAPTTSPPLEQAPAPPRLSRLTGRVIVDSTRRPLAGVEISLADLGRTVSTDDRGTFDMRDVPPGPHRISARKIGYGPLDTTLTLEAGDLVNRDIVLTRVVTLDSVNVTERAILPSFEEHMRAGFGHFLTRGDLAKLEGVTLGGALSDISGIKIKRNKNQAFATSARGTKSLFGNGGTGGSCLMHVYLDNMPIYNGKDKQDAFDLNSLSPDRLEGIEIYSGPAQIPVKYQGLNTNCGVIVLWTRRTFADSAR